MDWNEILPWGLTLGQTGFLCIGGIIILMGLIFLRNLIGLAKSGFLVGLALLMACIFFATLGFYLLNQ